MNMKIDSKDEINSYSQAAYSWLMLITNYYKRVNELDLNIDEMMTLNTISAHWLYKINSKNELGELVFLPDSFCNWSLSVCCKIIISHNNTPILLSFCYIEAQYEPLN